MAFIQLDTLYVIDKPRGVSYSSIRGDIVVNLYGTNDIAILRWDGTNLILVTRYTLPGSVSHCRPEFSPDGNYIAVSYDAAPYFSILSWDGLNIAVADTFTLPNYSFGPRFSGDGQYIAVPQIAFPPNDGVYVLTWDGVNLGLGDVFRPGANCRYADFAPDGIHLVVSASLPPAGGIFLLSWDGVNLVQITTVNLGLLNDLTYSPDGNYILAVCIVSPYTRVLDPLTLATIASIDLSGRCGRFTPDNTHIGLGGSGGLGLPEFQYLSWDGVTVTKVDDHTLNTPIYGLGWSPDGQYVAVNDYRSVTILSSVVALPTVTTNPATRII